MKEVFAEKHWSTVGDLSLTEDGKQIFLASHAHGVQQFDRHGTSQASYIVEGTPNRVSASFFGERVVASTIERHLYWLDADGAVLWAAETPEPVVNLICDPLGEWLILGFQSGRGYASTGNLTGKGDAPPKESRMRLDAPDQPPTTQRQVTPYPIRLMQPE